MNAGETDIKVAQESRTVEPAASSGCCGGPAPVGTDACCAQDAAVKSTGGSGSGCQANAPKSEKKTSCCG
jgi:hypothetical protein